MVSGTPTTAGTFTITFKVIDSKGQHRHRHLHHRGERNAHQPGLRHLRRRQGTVGTAYTATFTVTGGTAPFTYSKDSGTLPPGLTLGTSTGKLTGTPTTAGTYTFTIKGGRLQGELRYGHVHADCGRLAGEPGLRHLRELPTPASAPATRSTLYGYRRNRTVHLLGGYGSSLPPGLTSE